jgi:hypothetical protein
MTPPQRFFSRGERPIEHVGLAQCRAVIEPHARPDKAGGLFAGNSSRGSASLVFLEKLDEFESFPKLNY